MKRGAFIAVLAAVILVLILALKAGWFETPRPNLLILSVDTLRPDHLGCYGYPIPTSPTIDALVAGGVRFTQAVCQMPTTTPSFSSIMTGTYPHTHGSRANSMPLIEGIESLAERLGEEGYHTAAFVSSYTVSHTSSGLGRGFDIFDDDFQGEERGAGLTNERLFAHLEHMSEGSFFLWVHYFEPHSPYQWHQGSRLGPQTRDPERPVNTMRDGVVRLLPWIKPELGLEYYVHLYDVEIAYVDDQISLLLTELRKHRLLEHTLIVFLSDHGESFDHGLYCRHGLFLYESSVRIPLAVVFPRGRYRGRVIGDPVESIDVLPTVCEYLGVRPPDGIEGRSLLPLICGSPLPPRPAFQERRYYEEGNRFGVKGTQHALRTPEWKYILSSDAEDELYRLSTDPGERKTLIGTDPERASELRGRVEEWLAEASAPLPDTLEIDEEAREKLKALGYIQ